MPILTHATDAQLASAVEDNLFDLFRAIATLPEAEIVEGERLNHHHSFPVAPMFNAVWDARLAEGEVDSAIEEMKAWYRARHARLASWWFSNRTLPAIRERLPVHGFELDYAAPAMAIDLDAIPRPYPLPDGLTIVEARDAQTLADWSVGLYGAYAEDYGMSMSAARVWEEATLAAGDHALWRAYTGYYEGQPVATNLVFNGGGVAGLFCVGTIPAVRGKGFGRAITLAPLLDALDDGYRYGVLFASAMGLPAYLRMGWREIDNVIGRYVWENA